MNSRSMPLVLVVVGCCLILLCRSVVAQTPQETTEQQLQRLVSQLRHKDPEYRVNAGIKLGRMGSSAAPIVPVIVSYLKDKNPAVRQSACFALTKLWSTAAPAVPALIKTLMDKDDKVRTWATFALGNIGSAASPAIPALKESLYDKESGFRTKAALALGLIAESLQDTAKSLPVNALHKHLHLLEPLPKALAEADPKTGNNQKVWTVTLARIQKSIQTIRTELQKRGGK